MIQNRIDLLKKFIEEDPSDPFNVYALALEYIESNPEKAKELFEQLLKSIPPICPRIIRRHTSWPMPE
jgi:Cytochrome c biogenesis factor